MSKLLTPFCSLAEKSNIRSSMKKTCLALLCMAGFSLNAQVSSYAPTGTGVGQTYTDLTGATAVFGSTTWDNNVVANVGIGFNFNFNGKVYTTLNISSNGFVTFGAAPAITEYSPISSAVAYEGVIAAYALNLRAAGLDCFRQTQGVAPNRTFTVQWTAYRNGVLNTPINMQIILHESDPGNLTDSGVIDIKYKANPAGGATQATVIPGQIGLRGENNTDFNNKAFGTTGAWPTAAPVLVRGTSNSSFVNTRFQIACITAATRLTWTPPTCFAPRKATATPVSIAHNAATITWVAPSSAPSNGYEYLVSTTAPVNLNLGYPLPGTVATGSVGAGTLSASVSPLTPNTVYYIYVRSDCGGFGGWSAAGTFTTLCSPFSPLPYLQDFETGYTVPAIPPCNKVEDLTGEVAPYGKWVTNTAIATPGPYGFLTKHAQCTTGGSYDNNTTYFIEGIQLTAGVSYRLAYKYGASTEFATTEQSMSVKYYTAPYSTAPAIPLADHPSIKSGPFTNVINFVPAVTAVYYIGFNDYSLAANATLLLDDISLSETICFAPVLNAASGISSGSAFVSWAAAVPAPASGYQYYVSTSATPPTSSSTISGTTAAGVTSVTIGGLAQNTQYYVWVRSNCGGGDFSGWSANITFTTLVGAAPPTCVPVGISFQDPNGITNVTFSNVNNTTGIEPNNYGDYSYLTGYASRASTMPLSITYRTGFSYDTVVWIDWDNNGTFIAGEIVYSGTSAATPAATLNASIAIPAGAPLGPHRMRIGGVDFGPLTDPCRTGTWQAFEDYTVHITAISPTITVSTSTANVCQGTPTNVNITSTLANYDTYTWFPLGGVTGTAPNFVLNPTATTTYTLTGFNSTTFQRYTTTVTITIKPTPTAVTINPSSVTVCQNATTFPALTASGGTVSGAVIYTEDFNGAAPGWVQTNSTVSPLGDEDLAAWGLYLDGSVPPNLFFTPFHSNDNTSFAFTNSDGPGQNSTTDTTLTSPAINLTGYVTATLNFYQYYEALNNSDEYGIIEITTNNGASWTTLFTHDGTGDTGGPANFSLASFDLSTYAAASNTIKIRFRYHATWDWGWAIDNFAITGSAVPVFTWAPTTGLYNDASGAVAYTGDARAIVYVHPAVTTPYTATATAFGCPVSSSPVTVTITPISGGTMPVTSQVVCGGAAAADIVLTPATVLGTILYWETSTDPTFATGVTTIASNSATLTSALIGTVTATRYYRAVVSASGCSNANSPVHTINVPVTTWNGTIWSAGTPNSTTQAVFNASYTVVSNMAACSVVVNTGNLTVNPGVTLTVQNGVTVATAANMIFENTSSLVQVNPTAVNTGDIIYRRVTTPMREYDYTYWSSPVNTQILAKLSPLTASDKYYWFNTTTYQWTSIAAPGITPMTVGRGYIIRAPDTFTATPTTFSTYFGYDGVTHGGGVPNNGNIVVPVGFNSITKNLDCIGNPYPSAISANLFMLDAANTAALGAGGTTLYFWTHNTPITAYQYAANDYASYNYSGGVGVGAAAGSSPCTGCNNAIPNGNIAAGQAFMAKVVASGNVTFKNTMRLTGNNNQFWRMANQEDPIESLEKHRVWLELKNSEGAFKQMLVGYIESATNGIDAGFDGELVESGNPVSMYSIMDNTKLTIQGKALPFNSDDAIPLGYRTAVPGTFEIAISDKDGLFVTNDVYLEDKLLNVLHNLKASAYSFTTETGTFDARFVLRFVNTTLGVAQPTFDENAVVVYKNNQTVHIETANVLVKSVKIYDLRGREILFKDHINSNKTEISNLDVAQQVLLVQVTSTDNVTVTKRIIF